MENNEKKRKKQLLRKKFLKKRLNISKKKKKMLDNLIINNLLKLDEFKSAKNVLIYYPFKNEVNVLKLINILKNKKFFLPIIDFKKEEIKVYRYNKNLIKNKYGIYEPIRKNKKFFPKEKLDFILVPGIVFDKKCFRLGYGKGYYDKFLKDLFITSCGICYDFQIVEKLPVEKNDIKLSYIVSEKRIIKCCREKGDI